MVRRKTTRSPAGGADLPSRAELEALKLSPEVAHFLITEGIPLPDCPPKIKTPEPGEMNVPGAQFDGERVRKVLRAFGGLRHTKGKWAGSPLKPDPWQVAYILAPVFGWVRWDDEAGRMVRVIRELYVDIPRKNGKSTILGGIAIYMTAADGEAGAEVVAAATTADQAGFVFAPVKALVESAPALKGNLKAYARSIVHPSTASSFKVISSAADAQHGANLHCAVIDELHVHKTADLVDVLETGTGSRDEPLICSITTADDGRPGANEPATVTDAPRPYEVDVGVWAICGMSRKPENIASPVSRPVRLVAATAGWARTRSSMSGCATRCITVRSAVASARR